MANASRREIIKQGLLLAGAGVAAPNASFGVQDGRPAYETYSSARQPHIPVRIVDTERMPWSERKILFVNPETRGRFFVSYSHPPGPSGGHRHYHQWHEWGYMLFGDAALDESTDADQQVAPVIVYREGYFLDRPPYCIHSATRSRFYHNAASSWVFMEEGNDDQSFSPDPDVPSTYFAKYNPEHKKGLHWNAPQVIDTIGMQWEPVPSVPGLMIKRLADDPSRGFRVVLRMLEPGWASARSPQFCRAYYHKQGYQFSFVISGDLRIQTYRTAGEKAEQIQLGRYFYVERAPMSIFGLAEGVVSEHGCIWLEATYGKGATISTTRLEPPVFV
jgi:hypothetical protein